MRRIDNLDQIVSIRIQDEYQNNFYEWKSKIWLLRKEGFYSILSVDGGKVVSEETLGIYNVRDKIVYNKPRVIITFSNNKTIVLVCDDMKGTIKKYDEIAEKVKYLKFSEIK